ncbi:hypothetical protein [Aeromicrobium sp.]|uniref:hypothetical protein n=1 Tax=Aeromicrobium sp. TaxID=1871063 RepID=UPI0019B2F23F|nr:hypothetical protein [Aeromicrobium sp.]MBC7629932.1 hypothetical protein [Aeromicrobium sp.]
MFGSGSSFALLEEAVRDGRSDVAVVAHEVGASAAQVGIPLHEVLDHVERAHAGDQPAFETVRAAALAWAEEALIHHANVSCEDPLTSLATVPHVRSRLAEIYRGAERVGCPASDTSALVVVELPVTSMGHELEQSLRALEVAEVLRSVFSGDETVAQLSARRFAALVARERADGVAVNLLAMLLEEALGSDVQPRLWVEHLPGSVDGVARVLAGLSE